MSCPNCGINSSNKEISEPYKNEIYPEVEFVNVVFLCYGCGYSWNCIGSKKIEKDK